jgi:hypothetical protein
MICPQALFHPDSLPCLRALLLGPSQSCPLLPSFSLRLSTHAPPHPPPKNPYYYKVQEHPSPRASTSFDSTALHLSTSHPPPKATCILARTGLSTCRAKLYLRRRLWPETTAPTASSYRPLRLKTPNRPPPAQRHGTDACRRHSEIVIFGFDRSCGSALRPTHPASSRRPAS